MTSPELPALSPEILESLPVTVQIYIRELQAALLAQQNIIETHLSQLQQIPQLQAQVTELQRRLDRNSQNSSQPPSSDPPWQRPAKIAKVKTGKKQGGQSGHLRHTRQLVPVAQVDEIREWWPHQCHQCARPLRSHDQLGQPVRHQVWEIQRLRASVTEHQCYTCECRGCGQSTSQPRPPTVPLGHFGPQLVATLATLHGRYRITTREVQEIAQDLWQVDISLGAVADGCHKASLALAPSYAQAHAQIQKSEQANVDETGWYDSGKRGWLWVAVSRVATVFMVAARRSRDSFHALVGAKYRGIINSDRYNAYYGLEAKRHQLCWAHLLRNLAGLASRAGPAEDWVKQCLALTTQLFELWHAFRGQPESEQRRATLVEQVAPIRVAFKAQLEQAQSHSDAKVVTFSREVLKLEERLWVFVNVPGIEPTNNVAERALRPAVIWRKTSFGTQSAAGQRFVERMLSVEATCQKAGRNFLDFLADSLAAQWYNQPLPNLFEA